MKLVIGLCLVGFALAMPEKPGPYPAKGWKPQGARLELPARQYGVPRAEDVEITTASRANEYVPPTTTANDVDDALRVQGLPGVDAVSQFNTFQQKRPAKVRQQFNRIQMAPAPAFVTQPFLLTSSFAPQFAPVEVQLREQQFGRVEQAPELSPKNDAQQLPARAYGPPATTNNNINVPEQRNEAEVPQSFEPEQPQDDNVSNDEDDDDSSEEESDEPSIAVSSVVSNGESSGDAAQQGLVGQYYLLLPDNSLQKVRFTTKQTLEDRQINGFSAQLRQVTAQHSRLG